jgi:hypothetical protein
MSGTAALAAARKRRANPQPNVNPISNANSNNSNGNSNVKTNLTPIDEEFPKATNPAMLLLQHNKMIQNLQKDMNELKELKPKGPETDYKSEYLGLLEEMKEMKKVLLKVQSFSMETNLEVMKLKRITDSINSNPVNQMNSKMDLSTITETNDADTLGESIQEV